MLLGGACRATGCGSMPASTPRPIPPRRSTTSAPALNERIGLHRLQAQPLPRRHPRAALGRGGAHERRVFRAACARPCPTDYEFAFDAHAKIFEPWQAIQLGNALAPYDPLFFEEPIRPENIEAWGELEGAAALPAGDRRVALQPLRVPAAAERRAAADIIQPDICVVGGLLEMRKIAAIAEAHYVTVAPHNPMGPLATAVNLHFCAAQPNFKILEYRLPLSERRPRRVKDPYLPKDGYLELRPDRPGWGVEIDEDVLAHGRLRPLGAQAADPAGRVDGLRAETGSEPCHASPPRASRRSPSATRRCSTSAGVHEPWALRSIIEIEIEGGGIGLGESYGDEPSSALLRHACARPRRARRRST